MKQRVGPIGSSETDSSALFVWTYQHYFLIIKIVFFFYNKSTSAGPWFFISETWKGYSRAVTSAPADSALGTVLVVPCRLQWTCRLGSMTVRASLVELGSGEPLFFAYPQLTSRARITSFEFSPRNRLCGEWVCGMPILVYTCTNIYLMVLARQSKTRTRRFSISTNFWPPRCSTSDYLPSLSHQDQKRGMVCSTFHFFWPQI
jgi:hypothetical protein